MLLVYHPYMLLIYVACLYMLLVYVAINCQLPSVAIISNFACLYLAHPLITYVSYVCCLYVALSISYLSTNYLRMLYSYIQLPVLGSQVNLQQRSTVAPVLDSECFQFLPLLSSQACSPLTCIPSISYST